METSREFAKNFQTEWSYNLSIWVYAQKKQDQYVEEVSDTH